MWPLANDYDGHSSYYSYLVFNQLAYHACQIFLGTFYLALLLLGNACSFTFSYVIVIIHCFKLEYNG